MGLVALGHLADRHTDRPEHCHLRRIPFGMETSHVMLCFTLKGSVFSFSLEMQWQVMGK